MDKTIKFNAIEQNGTLHATTTANGYGHWFEPATTYINGESTLKSILNLMPPILGLR